MPDVSVLSQAQQHPQSLAIREKTLNLRELSKDSGIHELMEEEKRKSARRKEWVFNSSAKKANVPLASYDKILRFEQYPICTILGLLNE